MAKIRVPLLLIFLDLFPLAREKEKKKGEEKKAGWRLSASDCFYQGDLPWRAKRIEPHRVREEGERKRGKGESGQGNLPLTIIQPACSCAAGAHGGKEEGKGGGNGRVAT